MTILVEIRRAASTDWPSIWPIFRSVVAAGDTYVYAPDISEEEAYPLWMSPSVSTYVAEENGVVVGAYLLKPNQPGLGAHVCNAAFMVSTGRAGRGVGRAMGQHALSTAKKAGYLAMQFNFVVSTNERALALWKSLGFAVVGTVPQAYRHENFGLVDVYVMHRLLD